MRGLESSWNVPYKGPAGGPNEEGARFPDREDDRGHARGVAASRPASRSRPRSERRWRLTPTRWTARSSRHPRPRRGNRSWFKSTPICPIRASRWSNSPREADETARRLGFRSLEVEIPRGTKLQIELTLPGVEIEDSVQQVVWRGRATSVQFAVDLPRTQPPGNLIGRVAVYCDGTPIGHVRFKLEITAGDRPPSRPASSARRRGAALLAGVPLLRHRRT